MKAFKDKSYSAPVEKIRKDLGKYNEKVDKKVILTRPKQTSSDRPLYSNPTNFRRKLNYGTCFLLFMIFALIFLFIVMIFSVIFSKNIELDEI
jgi:hypothetical protein